MYLDKKEVHGAYIIFGLIFFIFYIILLSFFFFFLT